MTQEAAPRRGAWGAAVAGGIVGSAVTAALLMIAAPDFLASRIVRQGLLSDPAILSDTIDVMRDAQYAPVLTANRAAIDGLKAIGGEILRKVAQTEDSAHNEPVSVVDRSSLRALLNLRDGDGPWAHVDMAGPGFLERSRGDYLHQPGGTGYGVRLIAELGRMLA